MTLRLGIITAPPVKEEALSDLTEIWGDKVELVFTSVLPECTEEAMKPYLPEKGDRLFLAKLENNTKVLISNEKLTPGFEKKLEEMKDQVDMVFMACGADFPPIKSPVLFIQPNLVFRQMIAEILQPNMRLGVVVPNEAQTGHVFESWQPYIERVGMKKEQLFVEGAYPHDGPEVVRECGKKLAAKNVDLVVVECLQYKENYKQILLEEVKKPVLLIRSVMGNFVKEFI